MPRFPGATVLSRNHHARREGTSLSALAASAIAGGFIGVFLARNFFETEKKIVHPIRPGYGVDDPQFARTIGLLMGQALLPHGSVKILQNGNEIFPAMLEAIESARKTVTFENFVFSEGSLSTQFAKALAACARRGVKVHFLQDAAGCNCVYGPAMTELREAGVEVEIFRFLHFRFNERTHRKLLVIDGELGFIGGAGISDQWLGDGDKPTIWRDTHYMVKGPVVGQVQQAFMDNWMQTRGCVLHGDDYFPELKPEGELVCQTFQSSSAEGADSARIMFIFSMAAARRSIRIANAYFIPDDLSVQTMIEARERGVEIEVIVPGPYTDATFVRQVGRARWKPMLESGVKFFEYQPARYHCKYMIVDDKWSSVGSCNFDNRSLRLNEEANLNVLDEGFARRHSEIFEEDKAKSRQILLSEWKQRPLREKIRGRAGILLRSQL